MVIEGLGEISEDNRTRINLQDEVGNYLLGEAKWSLDAGEPELVESARISFYAALERFMHSSYTPTQKINDMTLGKLLEYKNADWKNKEVLREIIDYFKSIAY
jgi:hypothetical protein